MKSDQVEVQVQGPEKKKVGPNSRTENERLRAEIDEALESEAIQFSVVAGLEAQIFDMSEQLRQYSGKIEALESALSDAAQQRETDELGPRALEGQLLNKTEEVVRLSSILLDLQNREEVMQKKIEYLNNRCHKLASKINAREEALAEAAQRQEEISTLFSSSQLEAIKGKQETETISKLYLESQRNNELLQKAIEDLREKEQNNILKIYARESALSSMAEQFERARETISVHKSVLDKNRSEIRFLTKNSVAANKHIQEIKLSTSWRITAPLRRVKDLMRKISG